MKKRLLSIMLICAMLVSLLSIPSKAVENQTLENVAVGKTVYARSYCNDNYETYGPGKLTDNIAGLYAEAYVSYYSSVETSEWVVVDLAGAYMVSSTKLFTMHNQGLPTEFSVLAFDGAKWVTVYEEENPTDDIGKGNEITFEPIECNAIMILAERLSKEQGGSYVFRLNEVQVFGYQTDATLGAMYTPKHSDLSAANNLAHTNNSTTLTTSYSGWQLEKMNNGSTADVGNISNGGQEDSPLDFTLSFSEAKRINGIQFWASDSSAFLVDFKVQVLGIYGWETVAVRTNFTTNATKTNYIFNFPEVDCSSVRVVASRSGVDYSGGYSFYVREIAVYGVDSDATLPVAPSTSSEIQQFGTAFASTSVEYNPGSFEAGLAKINDGGKGDHTKNFFVSEQFADATCSQYAGVSFSNAYWFNYVVLRVESKRLPEDFHISVYNGKEWVLAYSITGFSDANSASASATKLMFEEPILGSALKITVDKARLVDGNVGYEFRLTELVIYGSDATSALPVPNTNAPSRITADDASVDVGNVVDWGAPNFGSDLDNMIDAATGTYYSSNWLPHADNYEWVQMNFKETKTVHSVNFKVYKDGTTTRFPKDFEIQVYTAEGWKTVVSKEGYATACYRFGFAPIDGSAIRLVVTKLDNADASNYALIFSEMEVYTLPAGVTIEAPETIGERTNTQGTLMQSLNYAASADDESYVQLMFDEAKYVDRIHFDASEAGKFPNSLKVYAYTGEAWEEVYVLENYVAGTVTAHEFAFKPIYCSSVMVVATGLYEIGENSGQYGFELSNVYANAATASGKCRLLGDGTADDRLTTIDIDSLQQYLLVDSEKNAALDINMDTVVDVRDLVRMNRYFAVQ